MLGTMVSLLTIFVLSALPGAASGWASAPPEIRDALKARFAVSRIEVANASVEGQVTRRGAVLTLQADGVPAKGFRAVQANTKSPRFHVRDYARVEVTEEGRLNPGPGDFSLARGTRLVVLDLKAGPGRVRLFTHTLERVPAAQGQAMYGCTEFVFPLKPGDVSTIQEAIERWLVLVPPRDGGS